MHPGQILWGGMRRAFYQDLERLHDATGPWDFIFFTGDLAYSGKLNEFDLVAKELDALRSLLGTLGSEPSIIPVPGNHDLERPKSNSATAKAFKLWHSDPDVAEGVFAPESNEYRELIDDAFANYAVWRTEEEAKNNYKSHLGILPGDSYLSENINGVHVGVLALNSTFLQLKKGEFRGRLTLDYRQVVEAVGDLTKFEEEHQLRLLLTHHPPDWLHTRAVSVYESSIYPPDRFTMHLFGHIHEPESRALMLGGSQPRRQLQGASLFGKSKKGVSPIHGYSAGRFTLEDVPRVRIWPRLAITTLSGYGKLVADQQFDLTAERYFEYQVSSHLPTTHLRGEALDEAIRDPAALSGNDRSVVIAPPRFARSRCRVLPPSNEELAMLYPLVLQEAPDPVGLEVANSVIRDARDSFTSTIASAMLSEGLGNIEDMLATVDRVRFSGPQECYRRLYSAIALDKLDRCDEALIDLAFILRHAPREGDLLPAAQFNSAVCYEKIGQFEEVHTERFINDTDLTLGGNEKLWHKALTLELIICARTGKRFRYADLLEEALEEVYFASPKSFIKTLLNWQMYTGAPLSDENVRRLLDLEPRVPMTVRAGLLGQLRRTPTGTALASEVEERCAQLKREATSYSVTKWLEGEEHGPPSEETDGADVVYGIKDILDRLPVGRNKIYLKTYDETGYELGFGRSGRYDGHAHRYLTDVIFSPKGYFLRTSGISGPSSPSALLVPARTWLEDIELDDFFFLKFPSSSAPIVLPDKTDEKLTTGTLRDIAPGEDVVVDWFPKPGQRHVIIFRLTDTEFNVRLEGGPSFKVVP